MANLFVCYAADLSSACISRTQSWHRPTIDETVVAVVLHVACIPLDSFERNVMSELTLLCPKAARYVDGNNGLEHSHYEQF